MIDFNAKKGFLCDMDGVIYHGNHILPGAAEFIHWLQDAHKEYLFLTNNSGMTPRELHQKLGRMGLDVPRDLQICGFTNGYRAVACDPQLTTVEQRGVEVGREAAEILIDKVEGIIPTDKIEKRVVRTRLVVRGSSR